MFMRVDYYVSKHIYYISQILRIPQVPRSAIVVNLLCFRCLPDRHETYEAFAKLLERQANVCIVFACIDAGHRGGCL